MAQGYYQTAVEQTSTDAAASLAKLVDVAGETADELQRYRLLIRAAQKQAHILALKRTSELETQEAMTELVRLLITISV